MAADADKKNAAADRDPPGHDTLALLFGGAAFVLLLLSPWLVDLSGPEPFYKGPLVFPILVLALIAAGAIPALLRMLRNRPENPRWIDGKAFPARGAKLFFLMCFYPSAIAAIGLEIATFAALFLGLLITGRKPSQAFIVALSLSALAWLAFKAFLDIWFPQPWLLALAGF